MRRLLALAPLFALAPAALAQSITGTVLDGSNADEPMVGVNVVVVPAAATFMIIIVQMTTVMLDQEK